MTGASSGYIDAENDKIVLQRVDATNVQDLTALGALVAKLTDAAFSDLSAPKGQQLTIRTVHYTDQSGNTKRAFIIASTPIADISTDPSTDPNGLWIAGGGGLTQCRLKSVQGDYLTVHTFDGTTEGGTDILVAKDPHHRNSLTSVTIEGTVHTYTYAAGGDSNNIQRTNSWASSVQTEEITRPWVVNEIVYIENADHTGVSVSGTELKRIYNKPFRQWGKIA